MAGPEDCKMERNITRDSSKAIAFVKEQSTRNLEAENAKLRGWVNDLQSGMYINCVYCGHRYGPKDEVPTTMADILKKHIEQCPKHPMSDLKTENAKLREAMEAGLEKLASMLRPWKRGSRKRENDK